MPFRSISAAVLLCLSLDAAEVKLGPEVPLTAPGAPGAAFGPQYLDAVASNGRDFLVIWYDRYLAGRYALAFDATGAPKERYPNRLAIPFPVEDLASDGGEYVAIGHTGSDVYSLHLDANGQALEPPRVIASQPFIGTSRIASNGTTYLAAVEGGPMLLLDRAGVPIATFPARNVVWIGARDGEYLVVESRETCATATACTTRFELTTLSESGASTTTHLVTVNHTSRIAGAAAFADSLFLAVHVPVANQDDATRVFVFDGGVLRAERAIAVDSVGRITAVWDGENFVSIVSSAYGGYNVQLTRVSAQGTVIETRLLTELALYGSVRVASNGSRELMAWTALYGRDVIGRVTSTFADIETAEPRVLSLAPSARISPVLASDGHNELALWIDDASRRIEGIANGVPFTLDADVPEGALPAAAAGDGLFAIAWYDRRGQPFDVIVSRVAFDGRVLDRVPVATARLYEYKPMPLAIASGGGLFLVGHEAYALPRGRTFNFTRMTGAGTLEPVRATPLNIDDYVEAVQLVWNGSSFVAGISSTCCSNVSPHQPLESFQLQRIPPPGSSAAVTHFPYWIPFGFAYGAGRVTAVVMDDSHDVVVRQYDSRLSGTASIPLAALRHVGTWRLSLVWNGSEYVLAWVEFVDKMFRVRGLRLSATGEPIDDVPFVIADQVFVTNDWNVEATPALAVTPDGVRIAYQRIDTANHDAVRIYTRTLERLPLARRRSVR